MDSDMKWLLGVLVVMFAGLLIFGIALFNLDGNVVCEINPLDATDIFCYETE